MNKHEKAGRAFLIQWKRYTKRSKAFCFEQGNAFIKWYVFSCIIGAIVGLTGALFHHFLDFVTVFRATHPKVLWLAPIIGIFIVAMYQYGNLIKDKGTNFVLVAVRENTKIPFRTAPFIFISTGLSHLVGASTGREGAALQLGGAISGAIGHWMKLDEKDARIVMMCGMAAGFSALFGTPIAAAIFAMEVVSVGVMYYSAIFPCVFSALIAHVIAGTLGIQKPFYFLGNAPILGFQTLLRVLMLGVCCAILAILFCWVLKLFAHYATSYFVSPYVRIAIGGALIIVLTFLVQTHDYNGTGLHVISHALAGTVKSEAFLLKILFTAISLAVGYKGGEIVPVFFVGSTFGALIGGMLGIPAPFSAALGMVALFCGVTNCPLTSMLLAYELFGGAGFPLFALVCAISYMLSGYSGLYSEQKIIYSKLKPEYIGRKLRH